MVFLPPVKSAPDFALLGSQKGGREKKKGGEEAAVEENPLVD